MRHVFYGDRHGQTRITSAGSTQCLYAFKRVLGNTEGLQQYKKQPLATELLLCPLTKPACVAIFATSRWCSDTRKHRAPAASCVPSPRRPGEPQCAAGNAGGPVWRPGQKTTETVS